MARPDRHRFAIPFDAPIKDVTREEFAGLWATLPADERWCQVEQDSESMWNWDDQCWWRVKYDY